MAENNQTTHPADATTANGALSNSSTGSARLNLFFKAVRSLAYDVPLLHQLLIASWDEDAVDTLKIIFQARDCRGGKGEKKLFAEALLWLTTHHPQTIRNNIGCIPFFGMWKDLLVLMPTPFADEVLRLFAEQLRNDLQKVNNYNNNDDNSYNSNNTKKAQDDYHAKQNNKQERPPMPFISLAAKWAPSENHGNDKKTGSALKLAILLSEDDPKNALRDYRRKYLSPLRAHLAVIETWTCAKRWAEIPYSLVPSRSMDLHKDEFMKHDHDRFVAYLDAMKTGKSTIKGKQMSPHELVGQCLQSVLDEVVELQWKAIVKDTQKMGSLSGSLVLSDVSASMNGIPMLVSIALGLLISELTAPPFTNCVVTFHSNPTFHVVSGNTLHARAKNLRRAPWGGNTNFQAVFNLILDRAVENGVPPEHMPKKLFVISDMQFDEADTNYTTNFQVIKDRYTSSNYTMPQMVFWNVAGSRMEFPVRKDEIGVAMVSGFSPSILKGLLSAGEFATPFEVLRGVLDNPRYDVLKV